METSDWDTGKATRENAVRKNATLHSVDFLKFCFEFDVHPLIMTNVYHSDHKDELHKIYMDSSQVNSAHNRAQHGLSVLGVALCYFSTISSSSIPASVKQSL